MQTNVHLLHNDNLLVVVVLGASAASHCMLPPNNDLRWLIEAGGRLVRNRPQTLAKSYEIGKIRTGAQPPGKM